MPTQSNYPSSDAVVLIIYPIKLVYIQLWCAKKTDLTVLFSNAIKKKLMSGPTKLGFANVRRLSLSKAWWVLWKYICLYCILNMSMCKVKNSAQNLHKLQQHSWQRITFSQRKAHFAVDFCKLFANAALYFVLLDLRTIPEGWLMTE